MVGDGLHLLIEGELAKPLAAPRVKAFLRHFPHFIGMQRFTEPMVYETETGCCGIVGIVTSHIAIHAEGCLVWVDIFSCGYMNTEAATRGVVRLLGLRQHQATVLQRPMPPVRAKSGGPIGGVAEEKSTEGQMEAVRALYAKV